MRSEPLPHPLTAGISLYSLKLVAGPGGRIPQIGILRFLAPLPIKKGNLTSALPRTQGVLGGLAVSPTTEVASPLQDLAF
jgi:hypothetical protein